MTSPTHQFTNSPITVIAVVIAAVVASEHGNVLASPAATLFLNWYVNSPSGRR